jgi:hypothetical protein
MTMTVIRPVTITDSMLASSTLAEDTNPAYNAGTTYALGDLVHVAATHLVYKSLQAANTGNDPATATTWWQQVGPTNKWAMFDQAVGSVSTGASPLTVRLVVGAVTAIALIGLVDATEATVDVYESPGGSLVYTETISLDSYGISDWLEYWTAPIEYNTEAVFYNLPTTGASEIKVIITGSGNVGCGVLVAGASYSLGGTQYGATIGITDYSRKEVDEFGVTSLVQRSYARRMDVRLQMEAVTLNKVYALLSTLRATPCVWAASDVAGYESMTIYGWARDFSIDLAMPTVHYCTLQIEGLT